MRLLFANLNLPRRSAKRLVRILGSGEFSDFAPHLKLGQAQDWTAWSLGYAGWAELRKNLNPPQPSEDDESVSEEESAARRAYQLKRLKEKLPRASLEQLGALWGAWRPSSSQAVYGDEEDLDGLFGDQVNMEESLKAFARMAGLSEEHAQAIAKPDAIRNLRPADIQFTVDVLRALKWPVIGLARGKSESSLPRLELPSSNFPERVPVYQSGLGYAPGDYEDRDAMRQRKEVEKDMARMPTAPAALLMFGTPMRQRKAKEGPQGKEESWVFIGSLWLRGRWYDMPWNHQLKSVDDLIRWAELGWDLDAKRPETADDGTFIAVAAEAYEAAMDRMFSGFGLSAQSPLRR